MILHVRLHCTCRNSCHDGVAGHIATDRCISSHGGIITDHHTLENGNPTPNPHFFADYDWRRHIVGAAKRFSNRPGMIGISYAGRFTDHCALPNRHRGAGNNMSPAGNNYIVTDGNAAFPLCLEVEWGYNRTSLPITMLPVP